MDKREEKGGEGEQQRSISFGGGESSKRAEKAVTSADGGGDVQYGFVVIDGKKCSVRLKEQQNGGMLSAENSETSMGVEQQGPPLVSQDDVDAGPVKKLQRPKRESQIISPFNREPATIKNTYSRMAQKEKDGKDRKNRRKEVEKSNEKDKQTLKNLSSSSQTSFEKNIRTGAEENDKKEERCHKAKVTLSLGRSGSKALVKGIEAERSVVGGSLKRVSTETVGMSGDAKKVMLDQEKFTSGGVAVKIPVKELKEDASQAGSITPKEKETKLKSILLVDCVSNKPRKTVRWKEDEDEDLEDREDAGVIELTQQERIDIALESLANLAATLFDLLHTPNPKEESPSST